MAKKYTLAPAHDWLHVEQVKDEEVTKGGIVLARIEGSEPPNRGIVRAAGPGRQDGYDLHRKTTTRIPMTAKVGDLVLYSVHGRHKTAINGSEMFLVRDCEILGVLTEEAE